MVMANKRSTLVENQQAFIVYKKEENLVENQQACTVHKKEETVVQLMKLQPEERKRKFVRLGNLADHNFNMKVSVKLVTICKSRRKKLL